MSGILKSEKKWYERQPEKAQEVIILWDFAIQTVRKIKSNRPKIVVNIKTRKKITNIVIIVRAYDQETHLQNTGNPMKY